MNTGITFDSITQGLKKSKNNEFCRPDNIGPRLLKSAGHALPLSLFSLNIRSDNTVSSTSKFAKVYTLFRGDDETDYRPLCVPGKLMETHIVSTITNHAEWHNVRTKHQ